ncbi:response regulator [Methylobacillus sp. Pita1]|uniref:response regulator n=1 Tax=Methylobacillus sp. Pita1 TaxID=3382642 RepID=UPI0038B66C70
MITVLRVLMVEDNGDDEVLILETLHRGGFDVRHLRVETEAGLRQSLCDKQWDIVLSDYCLPSFDAEGTLRVLRETGCDIPAIIVSGTIGEDVAVQTIKHGADDYLLKQNLIRLVPAVQHALDAAEIRRQRQRLERHAGLQSWRAGRPLFRQAGPSGRLGAHQERVSGRPAGQELEEFRETLPA